MTDINAQNGTVIMTLFEELKVTFVLPCHKYDCGVFNIFAVCTYSVGHIIKCQCLNVE